MNADEIGCSPNAYADRVSPIALAMAQASAQAHRTC